MANFLDCPVCYKQINDPRVLPCFHSFCLKCLEETGKGVMTESHLPCPVCGKLFDIPTGGLRSVKRNEFMSKLSAIFTMLKNKTFEFVCEDDCHRQNGKVPTAVLYCTACCLKLCSGCCEEHEKSKADHRMIDFKNKDQMIEFKNREALTYLTGGMAPRFSDQHNTTEDQKPVCQDEVHPSRTFVEGDEANIQVKMEPVFETLSKYLDESNQHVNLLKANTLDAMSEFDTLKQDVETQTNELKLLIDRHASDILQSIEVERAKKLQEIQKMKVEVEEHSVMLREFKRCAMKKGEKALTGDIYQAIIFMNLHVKELTRNHSVRIGSLQYQNRKHFTPFLSSSNVTNLPANVNFVGRIDVDNIHTQPNLIQGLTSSRNCMNTKFERWPEAHPIVAKNKKVYRRLEERTHHITSTPAKYETAFHGKYRVPESGAVSNQRQASEAASNGHQTRVSQSQIASQTPPCCDTETDIVRLPDEEPEIKDQHEPSVSEMQTQFDVELVDSFKLKHKKKALAGLAWMKGRVYVVCHDHDIVFGYSDKNPFHLEVKIPVHGMDVPYDLVGNEETCELFISENGKGRNSLWRIRIPDEHVSEVSLSGRPRGLSISRNELLASLRDEDVNRECLHQFLITSDNLPTIRRICLPLDVKYVFHAVQTSDVKFIIVYGLGYMLKEFGPNTNQCIGWTMHRVSELSATGSILRSVDLPSSQPTQLSWTSYHLSVDINHTVFVTDITGDRVLLLNFEELNWKVLLSKDLHHIEGPRRLCWLEDKQELIVGGTLDTEPSFSMFNIKPSLSTQDEVPANVQLS